MNRFPDLVNINFNSIDFVDSAQLEDGDKAIINTRRNGVFFDAWNQRSINFIIIMSLCDLRKLDTENKNAQLEIILGMQKEKNQFVLDNKMNVVSSLEYTFRGSQDDHDYFLSLSKNRVVFVLADRGIDCYACKNHLYADNSAYNIESLQEYSRKKEMHELPSVIDEYVCQHLIRKEIYSAFFIDKHTLDQFNVQENCSKKNILKNRPEELLRDSLRKFLDEKMKNNFYAETLIDTSNNRLDFHTETDSNHFYLFEIKWLGESIHDTDIRISTTNSDHHARQGVVQTFDYIKQSIENYGRKVRAGYLVVFDCREQKTPIDYKGFSNVPSELFKKYKSRFSKFDNIHLNNLNPC